MKYKLRCRAIVEWTYEIDPEDAGYDAPISIEQLIHDDIEGISGEWWAYIPEAAFDDPTPSEGLVLNEFTIEDGSKPRPALLLMPDGTIHEVTNAELWLREPEPEPLKLCPDCGVAPGQPHLKGCDVARCKLCGFQEIQCDHFDDGQIVPMTLWTGEWPGTVECQLMGLWRTEGGEPTQLPDLNQLGVLACEGHLVWSPLNERWMLP